MKKKNLKLSSLFWSGTLILASHFFAGCDLAGTGVDSDAQVEVNSQVVGKSLASYYQQSTEWENSYSTKSPSLQPTEFAQNLQTLGKSTPLGKTGFGINQVEELDLSDTANGRVTAKFTQTFGDRVTRAEFVIKWDEKAKDEIEGNENVISVYMETTYSDNSVESAKMTDGDGDGLLIASEGPSNQGNLVVIRSNGEKEEKIEALLDAGSDKDFDTEADNKLVAATMTRKVKGELIAEAKFIDGDYDGYITDNSREFSDVIIEHFDLSPEGKPHVEKLELIFAMKIYSNGKEEPLALNGTEYWKNGREVDLVVENKEGGSIIRKNDTMFVKLITVKPGKGDTLKSGQMTLVMNFGQDLNSKDDDLFYELHIEGQKKRGIEKEGEFHFWADEPVMQGEDPKSGRFEMKVTYRNDETIKVEGEFSQERFTATFTGSQGEVKTITYTESGEVVEVISETETERETETQKENENS